MKSLWNEKEVEALKGDPLQLRIYSSRLLGRDPGLVLHGGGNTSLKQSVTDPFGDTLDVLFIKGSGRDLKSIEMQDFAPVRLETLRRIIALDHLSDMDLVRIQRSALLHPDAPNPSIEAILHAIIPYDYVDHTHADALVTITNSEQGEERIRDIYGDRVLILPYVHAGFALAKKMDDLSRNLDWNRFEGMIVLNHGIFTFADDARASYERMIQLASLAENDLDEQGAFEAVSRKEAREDLITLSRIRREISSARGHAVIARLDNGPEACGFSSRPDAAALAYRGPITLDHVIRIKPFPMVLDRDVEKAIRDYADAYRAYFERNTDGSQKPLDSAPRWGIWHDFGTIAFGRGVNEANVVFDIVQHTIIAMQCGEAIGGWKGLSEKHVFDMEYWPLQQAKLEKENIYPELLGKVAMVTGAASGIGRACAQMLHEHGAVVVGLDINPDIEKILAQPDLRGVACDASDGVGTKAAVEMTVRLFGGMDILVSNVGIFTATRRIEDMEESEWNRSIELNLSSHQRLLKQCIPYLKNGIDPAVVIIASKNVPAPGPGASAYSVAKAGLTQLGRIAAIELGTYGIRVNMIHPDAVYDTGLWTPQVIAQRAAHYGMSVEQYKTKNILKTEVSSRDVAALVLAMVGPAFAKTTGAQVPIDGGNDRVI